MKKLTKEEFIEKARKVHGDKYDYSKVEYVNNRTKVCIICLEHGEFWQQANSHLRGEGCPKCKGENISKRNSITKEQFIEKARKVHGDKYDYSKVEYVNSQTKVCIICPIHGEFWQTPNAHLRGSGCPSCAFKLLSNINIGKKRNGGYPALTKEQFIEKAKKVHGDKYDYSKVEYKNNKTKVCIICPTHGEFWQKPNAHLRGFGCYKCGREAMGMKQTKNTEEFIEEARKIHNNKYDYSKVKYTTGDRKICIICPIHGEFWQRPANHLQGQGCLLCSKPVYDTESFIIEAKKIHGNKYDYSKVSYIGNKSKVCIICKEHGEFLQTPHCHLQGHGCPYCKESKLEKEVEQILKKNDISFVKQCRKNTLNWLSRFSLDFYLLQYNIAIECQGKQHFRWNGFFGGENEFEKQIERDNRKAKLCMEHGVKLLYYTSPSLRPIYEVITSQEELIESIENENNFKTR